MIATFANFNSIHALEWGGRNRGGLAIAVSL